jgi:glycosyltransferase involved in cell wall biosynthesis
MTIGHDRKLRVLHVVDSLANSGGAELRLVDEAVALADRFDQRVVCLFERDDLSERLEAAGIEVDRLGLRGARAGRTWPWAAVRVHAALRKWPPDVVHTALFTGNLVGQLAALPRRLPVVSSFNRTGDLGLQRELQPGVGTWKGRTMQSIARGVARSDAVRFRAVSAHARDSNCALFGVAPARVTVIPRGIASALSAPRLSRTAFGLEDRRPLFVNVARLVPEKAQHLLIEAFASVRATLPDAQLAIAGAFGSADEVVRRAIARHGLDGSVRLLGWRADVRSLIATADVFVFSSLSEGSPSAVLEAMALGTPVVAFAIPPVVELTDGGRHATLVPIGSTTALAESMVSALCAAERDAAARAACEWASRFSLEAVAAQLGDLLAASARKPVGASR